MRLRAAAQIGILLAVSAMPLACPDESAPPSDAVTPTNARTFRMGFTDFPHDLTAAGLEAAAQIVSTEGDLAVQHFDDGIPWNEALLGTPYPDRWTPPNGS